MTFFYDVFIAFVYSGFTWHAAVAYFDSLTIEKFTEFTTLVKCPLIRYRK